MRKWKPSKKAARDFAEKMNAIDIFCAENGIHASKTNDSYYFTVNGTKYRVSNHTIAASNAAAFDEFGNQKRELYHPSGQEENTICITASKTRIIEIYTDLKAGYQLNKRGFRKW